MGKKLKLIRNNISFGPSLHPLFDWRRKSDVEREENLK